ncbi:MAG: Crp/Fnr family transcriptional regulator [Elusimicrobia bacterium]|nr:Crp/Fnr family transcriptional regulator [Elusimicrobiota bacterium]
MEQDSILSLLKKVHLFSGLTHANLIRIAKITRRKAYPKNKKIFTENTVGNTLYIVVSGIVKIFGQTKTRKKTFAFLESNEFFGELALVGEKSRSASAETVSDSELLAIHRKDFAGLLKKYPEISMNLLKVLCRRLYYADKEIEMVVFHDVFGRVIQVLMNLLKKYGKNTPYGKSIDFPVNHTEIAELAGTVREMVTKTISKLKALKCIDFIDNKIIVTDEKKLKSLMR